MSISASQVLEQFEDAFIQFLNPNTPQERRNAIDQAFVDFEKQVDSWRICLQLMRMTNNPHIHLIIQDTFIYVLKHRWITLTADDKSSIQYAEISFYMNEYSSNPLNIMRLTAKTIAWISVMENSTFLQQVLDFIASGFQNTTNCGSQLILLLVLLEEVYETGGAIPLLTEKKASVQSVIASSVSGITTAVGTILRTTYNIDSDIVTIALQILLILIPHNDLSVILDPFMVETLFKLIYEYDKPQSLQSMKCINELLMKRLIPYSSRDIYMVISNSISSIICMLIQHTDIVPMEYLKRINLMIYLLVSDYLSAIATNPQFDFNGFISNLIKYTQSQSEHRLYLQLLQIWDELIDYLLHNNWNGDASSLSSLLESCLSLILLSNKHPVLLSCDNTEEFVEDEGDILQETNGFSESDGIDAVTGDFEEIPQNIFDTKTAYDMVVQKSLILLSKLLSIQSVYEASSEAVYGLCVNSMHTALRLLGSGTGIGDGDIIRDYSIIVQLLGFINFRDHNLDILILLSQVINECYISNVYMYGKDVSLFYIHTLISFKQYIFLLNNELGGADIEGIVTSLYTTITNSITVPPNLLLITISNVMIYVAANCSLQNIFNLTFVSTLINNFFKETAQCPLVIQKQLLLFLINILIHNLPINDYKQALSALLTPLFNNITSSSSPLTSNRRSFSFRNTAPANACSIISTNTSVVSNSNYIRSVYLLSSSLKIAFITNKSLRDVLLSQLIPSFKQICELLCDVCGKVENSYNFENCRILWNFVLYASNILRSHKASLEEFFSCVASLLQQLPLVLVRIDNTAKAMTYELHALKLLRLVDLLVMERNLDMLFLNNVVILLSQIGNQTMTSSSCDVRLMYVKCCETLFSIHILSITKSPEVINYVFNLSQFLYIPLASEDSSHELLLTVLRIYKHTGMLSFYNTDIFKSQMRHPLTEQLLSEVHSTLTSDMLLTLYTINSSGFNPFYEHDLPAFISSIPNVTQENKDLLMQGVTAVTDMPSFQSLMFRLLKDIRIYSSCN